MIRDDLSLRQITVHTLMTATTTSSIMVIASIITDHYPYRQKVGSRAGLYWDGCQGRVSGGLLPD